MKRFWIGVPVRTSKEAMARGVKYVEATITSNLVEFGRQQTNIGLLKVADIEPDTNA